MRHADEDENEEEERVPSTPAPLDIRECLALTGPELRPDENFPVGQF